MALALRTKNRNSKIASLHTPSNRRLIASTTTDFRYTAAAAMLTRAAKSKERKRKEGKKKISALTITVVAFGDGCGTGGRSCRPAARRGKLTGAGKGDEK